MIIEVQIDQEDRKKILETIYPEQKEASIGAESVIKDNFTVTLTDITSQKGLSPGEFNEIIEFTITLVSNVSLGILSNFLYDRLKGRVKKMWINDEEVDLSNSNEYEQYFKDIFNE
jgi:hypothetical protein